MFETTLRESVSEQSPVLTSRHRIIAVLAATMLEVAALGALLLVPLIHTLGIDLRNLRDQVPPLPPPPPAVKIIAVVHEKASRPAPTPFREGILIAPREIPDHIEQVVDAPAPQFGPDFGVIGGDPTGAGVPGSVLVDILQNANRQILRPAPREHVSKPVERIQKGGDVQAAKLVHAPKPEYPALAKVARVQGTVRLEAIIGADGRVQNLHVISGHPMLVRAALDAVSQWRYQPTLLNNEPAEVQTEIMVNFILGE